MSHCDHTACEAARLRDKLTGALIGLARATDGSEHLITAESTALIVEGLQATLPDEPDITTLETLLERAATEKRNIVPNCFTCACPCGRTSDYDMAHLWNAPEDIRKAKAQILSRIRQLAACHGHKDAQLQAFFYRALFAIGMDDWGKDELMAILREAEALDLKYGI